MNQDKFEDLLDRLGADLNQWPKPLGTIALEALNENPNWQPLLQQAEALNHMLDEYPVSDAGLNQLESQILHQTIHHRTLLDKFLNWLLPEQNLWRPVFAACLPIVVGLSIGLNIEMEDQLTLDEELSLTGLEPVTLEVEE